jgi:lipopolysaccharide biosynthesis regulator YciM
MEEAQFLLTEILKEHPMYASFLFVSLDDVPDAENFDSYRANLELLKNFFLTLDDEELKASPSVVLSQVRLLKNDKKSQEAFELLEKWMEENEAHTDVLKMEYIKLLIDTGKTDEALSHTKNFLDSLHSTLTRHFCSHCGYNSDEIFWRCPQCHNWETIQFRWKV